MGGLGERRPQLNPLHAGTLLLTTDPLHRLNEEVDALSTEIKALEERWITTKDPALANKLKPVLEERRKDMRQLRDERMTIIKAMIDGLGECS